MEENKRKEHLTPADFERVEISTAEAERISVKSMSFWEDAFRRLLRDKAAIVSLVIIALLIIFSVLMPRKPFNRTNFNGTPFSYKAAPRVLNDKGVEVYKGDIQYLPPKLPLLEKIGIFDGWARAEISSFDLIVGVLPKTDEWLELKKVVNRNKMVEALKIPYHPFDIEIKKIYDVDGVKMMDFVVLATNEKITDVYEKYISEYSLYKPQYFSFISSSMDKFGSNMIKVNRDLYAIQGVTDQYFWFGTDHNSFDNWTRLWVGIQVSLLLALCSLIFDFSIGITYGTISGFYAGTWIDNIMMRFAEIIGSVPFFVFLFIFISIKGKIVSFLNQAIYLLLRGRLYFFVLIVSTIIFLLWKIPKYLKKYIDKKDLLRSIRNFVVFFAVYGLIHLALYYGINKINPIRPRMLTNEASAFIIIIIAISITGWIDVTRLVRAQIIKLRDQEFVLAARTLGASSGRIMRKHLFPNIIGQLVVLGTFKIPSAIFSEAFLTFLGLGLPIPMSSLGMLVFNGYESIKTQPTLLIIPAFFMSLLMLAINLLANGLRDALDPRMR